MDSGGSACSTANTLGIAGIACSGKFGCADEVPPPEPAKGPPAPAVDDLPDDFSFFLGKCVASGTVTSGTMSKLSLTVSRRSFLLRTPAVSQLGIPACLRLD